VCGTSLKKKKTIILKDVREYDDYISCNSETLSETLIPIFMDDGIVAILDIDSPLINGFDQINKSFFGETLIDDIKSLS